MLTIGDADRNIGNRVRYVPPWQSDYSEIGVITEVQDPYVFVRYDWDSTAKATNPRDLTLITSSQEDTSS